jgi:hypothetical protein
MYHGNCKMRVMAAVAIGLDHISIGIVIESIAISSNRASMDVDGEFDGGFDGGFHGRFDGGFDSGFDGWFHLAVLGYQPQQSV